MLTCCNTVVKEGDRIAQLILERVSLSLALAAQSVANTRLTDLHT